MRVAVAGSSGLIGSAFCLAMEREGHEVRRLVRRPARSALEAEWDPTTPPDPTLLDGMDVVVNLAGANLAARRWTRRYREVLLRSRTGTAAWIAAAAAQAPRQPRLLLSASGIRYYGIDRGEQVLTESTPPVEDGFLARVAQAWEASTEPAGRAGIPVCHLRLGVVLSSRGGMLPRLLPLFRRGLAVGLGSADRFESYCSLPDAVAAVRFLAMLPGAEGPYNVTAPTPVRNREFTNQLLTLTGPAIRLHLPRWALGVGFGGIALDTLGSLRVDPARLAEAGFRHLQPAIADILEAALSDAI